MSDTVDIVIPPPGGIDLSTAPPVVIEVGGETPVIVDVTTPPPIVIEIGTIGAQGPPGVSNVPGPEGPPGATGAAGEPGPQGDKGETGDLGPAGSQGPEGPQGDPGSEGPQGMPGSTGAQGPAGAQGVQGIQGVAGSGVTMQGAVATQGDLPAGGNAQGDAWIVQADDSLWIYDGAAFVSGGSIQGPPGAQGPAGAQGVQGPQGVKGDIGLTGSQGQTGAQGIQGIQGPQGIQGIQGEQGAAGSGLSTAEYTYSNTLTPPPSTGQIRANSVTQSAITAFYLHKTNAVGVDIANAIVLLTPGNKLLVQDKTNAANYQHYTTVSATDNGSYFTVAVTWTDGGASFTQGRVMFAVFGLGVEHKWSEIQGKPDFGSASLVDYTISTLAPSGGADGDVWYQVT